MDLKKIHTIYFLGIGGIGMSALARYFNAHGKKVSGYDKTQVKLTEELISEGMSIHYQDNISMISDAIIHPSSEEDKQNILVIYTPAIPSDHSEFQYFKNNSYALIKRSEALGYITKNSFTIGVAGTHGKTTTSALLAHILTQSQKGCNAFLGGITQNYNTNLLLNDNSDIAVVEADEYDRSFLTLFPDIAIITSMDADHLDVYGDISFVEESFLLYAKRVKEQGYLLFKKGLPIPKNTIKNAFEYSITEKADFYAENLRIVNGRFTYDFISRIQDIKGIVFQMPGKHNVENSVVAIAAAQLCGVTADEIIRAMAGFLGVTRRFDYQIDNEDLVYIDDYAHHPAELKACINSVRELYPKKKITGIFQPHLYSRTRDFANEFASSLDLLDTCFLLPIYPARELPIKGITSQVLFDKMRLKKKLLVKKDELIVGLDAIKPEIILTLGAGDIDNLVEPIKKHFLDKQRGEKNS